MNDSAEKQIQQIIKESFEIQVEVMEDGKLPLKAHKTDAGFDLFATSDVEIIPGQVMKHPLNIRFKLPSGSYAQVESKSGLGSKGLLIYAGVIDENYRGIVHVIGTNLNIHEGRTIVIKKGQKIAQLTMRPHSNAYYMTQVEKVDTDTDRGEGGFGSSGS